MSKRKKHRPRQRPEAPKLQPPPPELKPCLEFPREAIGGLAELFADLYSAYLESPWSFFAFNFLTCLGSIVADKVIINTALTPEPRLYTVNLGESADDRKSESIKQTMRFFGDFLKETATGVCQGVGSAEGLAVQLQDNSKVVLIFDEFRSFVSKSIVDGSVLLPCVTTLFEDTRYHSITKRHSIKLDDAHLSLLAASTYETFSRMWTPAFIDIGFINRLWIVKDKGKRKYSIPAAIPAKEIEALRFMLTQELGRFKGKVTLPFEEEARAVFDKWYFAVEPSPLSKRLDGYGLRLMILLAVNEGLTKVTGEIAQKVVKLLEWELAVRKECDPIDAEGVIARMEEGIRRALIGGPMDKRDLQRKVNYSRAGIFVWEKAIGNLIRQNEILLDASTKAYRLAESPSSTLSSEVKKGIGIWN